MHKLPRGNGILPVPGRAFVLIAGKLPHRIADRKIHEACRALALVAIRGVYVRDSRAEVKRDVLVASSSARDPKSDIQ
jgi:hypothetical protein